MQLDSDSFLCSCGMVGDSESTTPISAVTEPLQVYEDEIDFLLSKVEQIYSLGVCCFITCGCSLILLACLLVCS